MIKGCNDKVLMECNVSPVGEFGKSYMAYSGCYWCECADECREVYDNNSLIDEDEEK